MEQQWKPVQKPVYTNEIKEKNLRTNFRNEGIV